MGDDTRVTHLAYPSLEAECGFTTATLRFEFGFELPAAALLTNVHLVAFAGGRVVLAQPEGGDWMLPGGTLEPGETWRDAAARELEEEAGARLLSATPFGVLRGVSTAAGPYRPHLAWPVFYWVLGWAEVELVGPPTQPLGGERIADVQLFDEAAAAAAVDPSGGLWTDIVRLAIDVRRRACEQPSRLAAPERLAKAG